MLVVEVSDQGPGIGDIEKVLDGEFRSSTGMGLGLQGTRRLMDEFEIHSEAGRGTVVRIGKVLPAMRSIRGKAEVQQMAAELAKQSTGGVVDELQRQSMELLEVIDRLRRGETELERRQTELDRLNTELEETNRGVVALYAEVDEKAVALRRADELKSRFLSHVSHEFRTPVSSILALTQLLLRRSDGELSGEQEKQVGYIRKAAQDLQEMVNDLLDLAKVEAGKTEVRQVPVDLGQMVGALRGIMRPLATNEQVKLVIEDAPARVTLTSDEAKITQILRNLVSNALKFTEAGEVRVSFQYNPTVKTLAITVADTGVGIALEDQQKIFQEFTQVDNKLQCGVKGTGLGLSLSRKLAELLGGTLEVISTPGIGSAFTLRLPAGAAPMVEGEAPAPAVAAAHDNPILIIDDEETARYIARQLLRGTRRRIVEAATGSEGAERARFDRPALILLDLVMPDRNGFEVLDDLKSSPETRDIPVVIHTSRKLIPADEQRLSGRFAAVLSKGSPSSEALASIRSILDEPDLFKDLL